MHKLVVPLRFGLQTSSDEAPPKETVPPDARRNRLLGNSTGRYEAELLIDADLRPRRMPVTQRLVSLFPPRTLPAVECGGKIRIASGGRHVVPRNFVRLALKRVTGPALMMIVSFATTGRRVSLISPSRGRSLVVQPPVDGLWTCQLETSTPVFASSAMSRYPGVTYRIRSSRSSSQSPA